MRETVTLNGSDVRQIIAKFLGIPLEAVIPMKYSFVISGISAEEIEKKLKTDRELK